MATKKDLVEAYSFSRRRLVTAFVSGAPGGREVEPNRPGRAIVGGLALAVLLVAGGAVLGIIKSPGTADLDKAGSLVSEKETGADYLVLETGDGDATELRPLVNITSAMLLFGNDIKSEKVPRSELNDKQIGDPIGILDAPATPPQRADLVQTGWTACTGVPEQTDGIKVDVSESPQATPTPDVSVLVRTAESKELYLVAQSDVGVTRTDRQQRAYAYRIPEESDGSDGFRTAILNNVVGITAGDAVVVPDKWVTLFPAGGTLELESFGITADDLDRPWGPRASLASSDRDKAQVGDLLITGSGTFLMTSTGTLQLDPFSEGLIRAVGEREGNPVREFDERRVPDGVTVSYPYRLEGVSWPTVVRKQRPPGQLCAQLDVQPGEQPGVTLATTPVGSEASAEGVGETTVERSVDSGRGAFVLSGDWEGDGSSTPFLVDARGYSYAVGPDLERTNLGYAGVDDVVVPQDWIGLFRAGVPLTIDAARCPPTSDPDGTCS